MEAILFFFVCVFVVLLLALPVIALIQASHSANNVKRLERQIVDLRSQLHQIQTSTQDQPPPTKETAHSTVEPKRSSTPPTIPQQARPLSASMEAEPSPGLPPAMPSVASKATPASDSPDGGEAGSKSKREEERAAFDWEQFMGAKLFAWFGGLALFLGVAFFLKYAFDRDLIPPWFRVAMGFLTGLGLVIGGYRLNQRKYGITTHALFGTGVLVLYATTFACREIYHFPIFGLLPTFVVMASITLLAFFLAIQFNGKVIAVLGLVGGFLTPFLLLDATDRPYGLFGYIAFLNLGLFSITLRKQWFFLTALTTVGTLIIQWNWYGIHFTADKQWLGLAIFLLFSGIAAGAAFVAWRKRLLNDWFAVSAMAQSASVMLFTVAIELSPNATIRDPGMIIGGVLLPMLIASLLSFLLPRRFIYHALGVLGALLVLSVWAYQSISSEGTGLGIVLFVTLIYSTMVFSGFVIPTAQSYIEQRAPTDPIKNLHPLMGSLLTGAVFLLLTQVAAGRFYLSDPSPVFGLALLLVLMLLGLAYWLRHPSIPLSALVGAVVIQYAWQFSHGNMAINDGKAVTALLWHVLFFLLFVIYPFVAWRQVGTKLLSWIASALSGPLHFLLVYMLVKNAWPNEAMGIIPGLFAIPSLIALASLVKSSVAHPGHLTRLAWFGGVALLFITLIVPIQLDREWITMGWAFEGVALLWLFHRIPHVGLKWVGLALLAVVFVRLTLNPAVLSYHTRAAWPFLNWYLYTYGLGAACFFAAAWLLRPPRHRVLGVPVPGLLCGLGVFLGFLLLNIEIADYFTPVGNRSLTIDFSASFGRDMTYTIAWSLFALGLVVVGLVRRIPIARYAGIALLGATLLKLFLHDLSTLPALYRIGALLGTAVVAIFASFLYQKLAANTNGGNQAD